jgi:hypothetical protein
MKKSEILFILAALLAILGLVEALSGFLLWFAIPRGGGRWGGAEQIFWGLTRDTWIDIHDWAAVALIVLVLIHIIYHWKWIVRMFKTCCPFLRPGR